MDNDILNKRTKGEWKIEYRDFGEYIVQTDKWDIATVMGYDMPEDEAEANAAFICKAVNNYDSLLGSLKDLVMVAINVREFPEQPLTLGNKATIERAKEAIKKAGN